MKTITLTQGQVALVDDEDYEELSKYKWCAAWYPRQQTFLATRGLNGKTILMHRVIMNAQPGQDVDHRNHDTLDNQRGNLRLCTNAENLRNMKPKLGTSVFKGVSWNKRQSKWHVKIEVNYHQHNIGFFVSEVEAAHAYDAAAHKYFGEFAWTNF